MFLKPIVSIAQDITNLGGDLTTTLQGHNALQVGAPNIADDTRKIIQLSGFSLFHRVNTTRQGLGPRFVNKSCGGCHVQNGKGPIGFNSKRFNGSTVVVKVSVKDSGGRGAPRSVPGVGHQLTDQSIAGPTFHKIKLSWIPVRGRYPDGRKYTLQKPKLTFTLDKINPRYVVSSLRMSPLLIGEGLLDAIPEAVILNRTDPDDRDGDGISGRPNYVKEIGKPGLKLGRFGFKATQPSLLQQTASAAHADMGLSNRFFPLSNGKKELSDDALNKIFVYQQIAGVPAARNQDHDIVQKGKGLFLTLGCESCHTMTVMTGASEAPELANQTIHPFSDLLLHDMGSGLSDRRRDFSARGSEWRTTPLWGLGFASSVSSVRPRYLHDGRARSIEEAILWHGGEARKSQEAFKRLSKLDRDALISFLRSL